MKAHLSTTTTVQEDSAAQLPRHLQAQEMIASSPHSPSCALAVREGKQSHEIWEGSYLVRPPWHCIFGPRDGQVWHNKPDTMVTRCSALNRGSRAQRLIYFFHLLYQFV